MVTNIRKLIIKTWFKSFHKDGMTMKNLIKDNLKGLKKPNKHISAC